MVKNGPVHRRCSCECLRENKKENGKFRRWIYNTLSTWKERKREHDIPCKEQYSHAATFIAGATEPNTMRLALEFGCVQLMRNGCKWVTNKRVCVFIAFGVIEGEEKWICTLNV